MIEINILDFIPQELRQQAQDTLVDFVSEQAKKFVGDGVADKLKQLRTDGAFRKQFDKGLDKALKRFAEEYYEKDEDLVDAIAQEKDIFKSPDVKQALMTMLKSPGSYLADEGDVVAQTFDSVLPGRKNRERVNKAMLYLLRCLVEELWHLPELQPVYSLQFQKITAEAMKQQVELQKVQLQALVGVNEGVRQALLQLTDAIGEKKLLPGGTEAVPAKPQVLHNLPSPDYGKFVGREEEISQIQKILRPYPHSQHSLVTIDGIGGVGKSSLALEVASRYLHDYEQIPAAERFDAIVWVSAKQTVLTTEGIKQRPRILRTLDDLFTAIAITLQREEITRARLEEQHEIVQSALTRQRTLLIVDNLETIDDEKLVTFLRELPAPTKAVVTTRHRIDAAYPVRLKQLPADDALKLIEQECVKKNVHFSADEARQLYQSTDGVPLAMVWSISQVALGYSVKSVLAKLAEREGDINKYCFSAAFEALKGKPSEQVLHALGIMPKDASREMLGNITLLDEIERDDALVLLEKLSLVNRQESRFNLLQLTKNFVEAKTTPEVNVKYRLSALEWIIKLFQYAAHGGSPDESQKPRYELASREIDNALGLIDWAINENYSNESLNAVRRIYDYMWAVGRWNEIALYLARGIEIAEVNADHYHAAFFKRDLGRLFRFQGKWQEAEETTRKALSLFEQINDLVRAIDTQRNLGMLLANMGQLEEADLMLSDCLAKVENIQPAHKGLKAHIMNNYVEVLFKKKDYQAAEKFIDDVEKIATETKMGITLITNHRLRGRLFFKQEKFEEAKTCFQRSLELSEQMKIIPDQAYALKWLARAELIKGDMEKAKGAALRALSFYTMLGMKADIIDMQDVLQALNISVEQQ